MKESSVVQGIQSGGESVTLTIEGEIPRGLRFYWEDETGKHGFAGATIKQARHWAHNTAKWISTPDFFTDFMLAIHEFPNAYTLKNADVLKECRKNIRNWFGQFHPTDRQWKIILVAVSELADRVVGQLAEYVTRNSIEKLTIIWEIESLPGDGDIYRTLLRGGKNEAGNDAYNNPS